MADPNFSSVTCLMEFFGGSPESSANDRLGLGWTNFGSVSSVSDAGALTGYYASFPGAGARLTTPAIAGFFPGTGNFVIDFGIKVTSFSDGATIADCSNGTANGWVVRIAYPAGTIIVWKGDTTFVLNGSTAVTDGARHHVAIVRSGSTTRLFIDGVLDASTGDTLNYSAGSTTLCLGARLISGSPTLPLSGKMDFFRISIGTDRGWTAAFTPPTIDQIAPQFSLLISDLLEAGDSSGTNFLINASCADFAQITSAASLMWHFIASDGLALSPSSGGVLIASANAADSLSASESLVATCRLSESATDGLMVTDIGSGATIALVSASDGVSIYEAIVQPDSLDDLVSVWVANAATAAHSRYAQYGFNSFARFGGKHYGCKSDGIYELNGDLDGTSPIKWTVTMPEMDFGTSNLKRFESIYVGMRASGQIVLKVVQDKNNIYHYDVIPSGNDARASRAILGRGLIGRYWQFELASDTNRAELESIDYSMAITSRRV